MVQRRSNEKILEMLVRRMSYHGIYHIQAFDAINKENNAKTTFDKEYVKILASLLIDDGLATERLDLNNSLNPDEYYIQLTDSGRLLKELGTIEAYEDHLLKENAASVRRQKRENRLYWINFWIAVGAVSAALYYLLEILRIQYRLGLPFHVFFS